MNGKERIERPHRGAVTNDISNQFAIIKGLIRLFPFNSADPISPLFFDLLVICISTVDPRV
jgi:hypothetical protein